MAEYSMNNYAFDRATVVLFNPLGQIRATLRDALHSIGFRDILDFSDLQRARNAVNERAPDLVLLDLDREVESVCKMVREVRHSGVTADPFVVMIALSWYPNLAAVNNSLEAGIDDIITMPISIKLITQRIELLIRARKDFVVTASYIGPDRRTPDRAGTDSLGLGTIRVPNNLRFKATGDATAAASDEVVAAVRARIDSHRLGRYAQRIAWLVDETLRIRADGNEVPARSAQRLDDIARLTDELADDLARQGHGGLLEICDSMVRVIENIRSTPTVKFYELLKLHALAVTATLLETEGAAQFVISALHEATTTLRAETTAREPRI